MAIDFTLSNEQRELQANAREFAETVLAPCVREADDEPDPLKAFQRTKDAYEAVWEHVNGRPLEYPAPRYPKPVFVHQEDFDWRPHGEGVTRALLGDFSEGGTRLAKYRVTAGATLPLDDHSLFYIHSGTASVNGREVSAPAAVHVERDEQAALTAQTDAELVQMGLTRLEVGMQNMEGGR